MLKKPEKRCFIFLLFLDRLVAKRRLKSNLVGSEKALDGSNKGKNKLTVVLNNDLSMKKCLLNSKNFLLKYFNMFSKVCDFK